VGVQEAFYYLLYAFMIALPPLSWLFLRNIRRGDEPAA